MEEKPAIIDGVKITHPSKLLFPEDNISKLDVANYYKSVSKYFLKELKNRRVTLVRSPDGIHGQRFFQKHPTESFPDYIERIKINEKTGNGIYILIDSLNDLMYLVNLGAIEFHTWGSTADDIEHPDRAVFDLDPDPSVDMKDVVGLAKQLKQVLENIGYEPKLKTSGNKGYHIIIDFKKRNKDWPKTKEFARLIAQHIVKINPELYTTELRKDERGGKIFIDFYRNERGATTVAAYSLRTKPTAPISWPIEWDDLDKTLPNKFNIKNYSKYLKL